MKKQTFIALFAMTIIVTLFFIPSCRKDHTKVGKEDLLSQAQDYYNRQLQVKISTDTNDIDISLYKPDWNQGVYSKTAAGEDVVGILLKRTDKEQVELDVTAEKNGDITGLIKRYVYATGKLMIYSGSGRLRMQGDYSLGTKTFKPDYKGRFLAQSMGGDLNDIYITGGGGGDTPPIIIITPPPTTPNPPSGGGSSTSGGGNNKLVAKITVDPKARDCIGQISAIIISNAGKMSDCIEDIAGIANVSVSVAIDQMASQANYNIELSERIIPDKPQFDAAGNVIGNVTTNADTNPRTGNISLNTNVLNTSTDLGIAATMIHEMMHSYFIYGITKTTGTEKAYFQTMNQYLYGDDNFPINDNYETAQHEQMAATYVNSMAALLQQAGEFCNHQIQILACLITAKTYFGGIFPQHRIK